MFNNLTANQWVAIAWAQVFIGYAGYLIYLYWQERRARRAEQESHQ